MKHRNKITAVLAACIALGAAGSVFAGAWAQDAMGWWYQNDDGTYPANGWQWIDGNGDDTAECYYFDPDGYCYMNTTTPDGYQVDASGAWIVNGSVQTQTGQSSAGAGQSGNQSVGQGQSQEDQVILGTYEQTHDGSSFEEGVASVTISRVDTNTLKAEFRNANGDLIREEYPVRGEADEDCQYRYVLPHSRTIAGVTIELLPDYYRFQTKAIGYVLNHKLIDLSIGVAAAPDRTFKWVQ